MTWSGAVWICLIFPFASLVRAAGRLTSFAMANASAPSANGLSLPGTSSSCLTQAVTDFHDFEVINFSLLEGLGVGKFVNSESFNVGGYSWNIRLYPDGANTDCKGYISAFLMFQGGGESVRVKYSFSVLGKHDQVWKLLSYENNFHQNQNQNNENLGWGWTQFMGKSTLQQLLRRNNSDRFTIRCVLTVIKPPRVQHVSTIVVPQPNLLQDFANLLKDEETADVTFSVGGQLFPAHRCVLATRSAVFRAELFGPMKEKTERRIKIDDMEPSIFDALLHFIYTDSLPDDCGGDDERNNVPMQHLLVAADRYGLDRLRPMCEEKMCDSIDAETVATTLALAEQHRCQHLKEACLKFIASRGVLGDVMGSKGFDHLIASCPLVLLDILDKLASMGI